MQVLCKNNKSYHIPQTDIRILLEYQDVMPDKSNNQQIVVRRHDLSAQKTRATQASAGIPRLIRLRPLANG